jgi:hypothetical protein
MVPSRNSKQGFARAATSNMKALIYMKHGPLFIRSAKQDDIYGASIIALPCPGS